MMPLTDTLAGCLQQYYHLRSPDQAGALTFGQRLEVAEDIYSGVQENDFYPYRRAYTGGAAPQTSIAGFPTDLIHLASNDYLNFTQHPRVIGAGIDAMQQYGAGSGSVPMLAGTTDLHKRLEKRLARFLGYEAVMLYNSGYAANYGTLTALLQSTDVAILDTLVHASLLDGCKHTNKLYFLHNDPQSLEITLQKAAPHANKLVIVDGVYSMDGDIARLPEIMALARQYGAWVMVDDAHGTGVLGRDGRGTQDHWQVAHKADILSGSFGKALVGVGGFIAGSRAFIHYLELLSRPYHFSCSLPPQVVASLIEAIDLLETQVAPLAKLWQNITFFQAGLQDAGFNTGNAQSAIFPLILPDEMQVMEMSAALLRRGIAVNPIFFPVVPRRKSRLRLSVTAGLSLNELAYCVRAIACTARELGFL
jgi:glycine C-acetyltransferase